MHLQRNFSFHMTLKCPVKIFTSSCMGHRCGGDYFYVIFLQVQSMIIVSYFSFHICYGFRGRNGETRRVQVSNYLERDPYDPDFEERIVHYAIYELAQDGIRTMYRQFLLMASGAIVEIFDQFLGDLAQKNRVLSKLLAGDPTLGGAQPKKSLTGSLHHDRLAFADLKGILDAKVAALGFGLTRRKQGCRNG